MFKVLSFIRSNQVNKNWKFLIQRIVFEFTQLIEIIPVPTMAALAKSYYLLCIRSMLSLCDSFRLFYMFSYMLLMENYVSMLLVPFLLSLLLQHRIYPMLHQIYALICVHKTKYAMFVCLDMIYCYQHKNPLFQGKRYLN